MTNFGTLKTVFGNFMQLLRNFDLNQKADLQGKKKYFLIFFLYAELNSENSPQCRFSKKKLFFTLKLKSLKIFFYSFF